MPRIPYSCYSRTALVSLVLILAITGLSFGDADNAESTCSKERSFTVADSIGLSYIVNPTAYPTGYILRSSLPVGSPIDSPDKKYFLLVTQRGNLATNELEGTIWLFRRADISQYLIGHAGTVLPKLIATMAAAGNTAVVSDVRWLDTDRIAFLGKDHDPNPQVFVVGIAGDKPKALTQKGVFVTAYDISGDTLVYATPPVDVTDEGDKKSAEALEDVRGQLIYSLLFPSSKNPVDLDEWTIRIRPNLLHVVRAGHEISLSITWLGTPLRLFAPVFRLSPDGRSLVALAPVKSVPPDWARYHAQYPYFSIDPTNKYHVAEKNPAKLEEFILVNLENGDATALVDAPAGRALSYLAASDIKWAPDGSRVLLANTFLPLLGDDHEEDRSRAPYVAVVDLLNREIEPVMALPELPKGQNDQADVSEIMWNQNNTITIKYAYSDLPDDSLLPPPKTYALKSGKWTELTSDEKKDSARAAEIFLKGDLNHPLALYATMYGDTGGVLVWDPNPELHCLISGSASLFHWKDKSDYSWSGILLLPANYKPNGHYPLVIQTHGVSPTKYFVDGEFTTGSGGRALSAKDIVVLQMADAPSPGTPQNGPNQLAGYESAIDELSRSGLIDPHRVGVIGFSYTCFHVLYAMTKHPHLFAAASITDGNTMSYMQYMLATDGGNGRTREMVEEGNGGRPFGSGLLAWFRSSPNFTLDKVSAPLLISCLEKGALLGQWDTYAGLRTLNKPVDIVWLRKENAPHILVQPLQRYLSQQGAVDWFAFWLKGEEDLDPSKAEQYARWRELRRLQSENDKSSTDVSMHN